LIFFSNFFFRSYIWISIFCYVFSKALNVYFRPANVCTLYFIFFEIIVHALLLFVDSTWFTQQWLFLNNSSL
jgi:hypothetical protein